MVGDRGDIIYTHDDDLKNNDAKMNKKTYLSWSISPPPPTPSILQAAQPHIFFEVSEIKNMKIMESNMLEALPGQQLL